MKRLIFVSFIFLISCTSIETLSSLSESDTTKTDYRFFDLKSKIRYQITNDDKNLYIRLNTDERFSIVKIIRTGLTIYFDVKGVKQTTTFFQYPIAISNQLPQNSNIKEHSSMKHSEFDLKNLIIQIPNKGIFVTPSKTDEVSVLSAKSDIKACIENINNTEIIYLLCIPFNRISENGIASLSNLSIGIKSGKIEMHSKIDNNQGSMKGGMQGQANGTHGRMNNGSRNQNINRGGEMESGNYRNTNFSSLNDAIEFWFKLSLIKSKN